MRAKGEDGGCRCILLTREASAAGDPSLRLKNGCAQDDAALASPSCMFF
jgi:hypothetical protein